MAYNFTVTTYLSQVNITPNAQGQFVIQSTASNINVSTQGTLVQFTSQPATTATLGAVKIGNGISVSEDGTISVGEDNDSSYVTISTFDNTDIRHFTNGAGYITLADIPPPNQLTSSTGGTVTLNGGAFPTLELSSSTYIVFDSPDTNGEAFLIGLLTAGEESATTSSFLYTSGDADFNISVNGNQWNFYRNGDLVLPNGALITDRNDYNADLIIKASSANSDALRLVTTNTGTNVENTWTFAIDGSLTLPNGSPILFGNGNAQIQAGMGFHIRSEEGISLEAVNVETTTTYSWYFSPTGEITFPDSTIQTTAWTSSTLGYIGFQGSWIKSNTGGDIYISPQDGYTGIYLPEDNINSTTAIEIFNYAGGGVQIATPSANYTFNTNGLTFPDASIQISAYQGTLTNVSTFINDVEYLTSSTVAQYIPPAYDQSLNTTDTPTFANLNILGTMTVVNTTVTNEIVVNKETITDSLTFGDGSTQTTAAYNYSLPTASTLTLGGVKVGFPEAGIQVNEYGELDLRLNAVNGTGTTASVVWNPAGNAYDWTYNLNIASTSTLGGIKIDTHEPVIVADSQGHLDLNWQFQSGTGTQWVGAWDSVQHLYTAKTNLLPATTSTLGGVKIGNNINLASDGTISVTFPSDNDSMYVTSSTLATTLNSYVTSSTLSTTLGNYVVSISAGTGTNVSTAAQIATVSIKTATSSTIGGVRGGANILIDSNGTIRQQYSTAYGAGLTSSDSAANTTTGVITRTASVLIATSSTLGGIKVGSGLSINSSTGILSVDFPADVDNYVTSGSNISIFNNDSGYITTSSLVGYSTATAIGQLTNDAGYITSSALVGYSTATAVSELTNDAGYITSASVPAQGSTLVYARNELPTGTAGTIITISDSGSDTNAPAGNWAPAYWDNDAEQWIYIGNSNTVTAV